MILCIAQPGDIVAIRHGIYGRKEGLVIGSHIDYAVRAQIIIMVVNHLTGTFSVDCIQGRQIVEVQIEPGEIFNAWYVASLCPIYSYDPF